MALAGDTLGAGWGGCLLRAGGGLAANCLGLGVNPGKCRGITRWVARCCSTSLILAARQHPPIPRHRHRPAGLALFRADPATEQARTGTQPNGAFEPVRPATVIARAISIADVLRPAGLTLQDSPASAERGQRAQPCA